MTQGDSPISRIYHRFSFKRFVTILILTTIACSFGCQEGIDCRNASDQTPEDLLAKNDYVFYGTLLSIDTLVYLGETTYYDERYDNYLLEYTFKPERTFTAITSDSVVHLWYRATILLATGYSSGLKEPAGSQTLIYGDRIYSTDQILHVLGMWISLDLAELEKALRGEHNYDRFVISDELLQVAGRLLDLTSLADSLEESMASGPVICATDYLYGTQHSFQEGYVQYCDSSIFWAYRVKSEKYLELLEKCSE